MTGQHTPPEARRPPWGAGDPAGVYLLLRAAGAGLVTLSAVVLGAAWYWTTGLIVAALGATVVADSLHRYRRGGDRLLLPLLLDALVIGVGVALARLPLPVVGAPLAYLITAALLLLPWRRAMAVLGCSVGWLALGIAAPSFLPVPRWSASQLAVLSGVSLVVFLGEMTALLLAASRAAQQRRSLQARLEDSEARYRLLYESNPQPMWVYDLESLRFLEVNEAAVAHYGFTRQQFLAMSIADIRPPEDLPALRVELAAARSHQRPISGTWRHRKVDGEIIYAEVTGQVIQFEGRPARLILASDVTQRLAAERQASDRRRQLERLLGVTRGINAGWTVEEILDSVFATFQEVLPYDRIEYALVEEGGKRIRTRWVRADYPEQELSVGMVHHMVPPRPRARPFLQNDLEAEAARQPEDHPLALLVREGIRSSLTCPLVLRGGVVGYLFFASRSERAYRQSHLELVEQVAGQIGAALEQSRLRQELLARNQELEELNRSRTQFIANVSHELRTPLTAVMGLAAEMRDRLDSSPPPRSPSSPA